MGAVIQPEANDVNKQSRSNEEIDLSTARLPKTINKPAIRRTESELWLRERLKELTENLRNTEIKEQLTLRRLNTSQMFEVLRHITPEIRQEFMKNILSRALTENANDLLIERKLPKILFFTPFNEKADLLNFLINKKRTPTLKLLIVDILKASKTRKELLNLISSVGIEKLLDIKSAEIKSLVGEAIVGTRIERLLPPKNLSNYASQRRTINQKLNELTEYFNKAKKVCDAVAAYRYSEAVCNYRKTINNNLREISRVNTCFKKIRELRSAVNELIYKSKIEFKYGVAFFNKYDTKSQQYICRWNVNDYKNAERAFKRIGAKDILFTPKLWAILREGESANDSLAQRELESGKLIFYDGAFKAEKESENDSKGSSFARCLVHEIGHSLSVNPKASARFNLKENSPDKDKSINAYRDFEEYLRLGGWKVHKRGYSITHNGESVKINNKHYPIMQSIVFEGEHVVFSYFKDEKILFSYRSGSQFSLGTYCQIDPFEDYAEAYMDYIMSPSRLITFAPNKFFYFENEFRRYDNNLALLIKARNQQAEFEDLEPSKSRQASLAPKANPVPVSQIITNLFSCLDPIDQSLLLANENINSYDNSNKSSLLLKCTQIYKQFSPQERIQMLERRLDASDALREDVTNLMLELHKEYFPALLQAIMINAKGEDLAILSLRGNKLSEPDANTPIIAALEDHLGINIKRRNRYLLNDEKSSKRISALNYLERKFRILSEFAQGFYTDSEGHTQPISKGYQQIFYYDTNPITLNYLSNKLADVGLDGKVIIVNANNLVHEEIWNELTATDPVKISDKIRIHFFEIDNTLLNLDAKFYIRDLNTKFLIEEITISEFLKHKSLEVVLQRLAAEKGINSENLILDQNDFFDARTIRKNLKNGRDSNRMFRIINNKNSQSGNEIPPFLTSGNDYF